MTFLRVHLIRHGQSTNNVLADDSPSAYLGRRTADAPLTALGAAQADALGRRLHATSLRSAPGAPPLSALYCSAMTRAVDTACRAAAIAAGDDASQPPQSPKSSAVRPRVWPALTEVGGLFELQLDASGVPIGDVGVGGLSRDALAAAFPSAVLPDADVDDPALAHWRGPAGWWHRPRRETAAEATARIAGVVDELARAAAALATAAPGDEFDVRAAHRCARAGDAAAPAAGAAAAPYAVGLVVHGDLIEIFMRLALQRRSGQGGGGGGGGGSGDGGVGGTAQPHAVPAAFWAANTSITTLDFFPSGNVRVCGVNDVAHLLIPSAFGGGSESASDAKGGLHMVTGGC